MTPLKPMNTIVISEKQQRTRNKSRSRTGTPSKTGMRDSRSGLFDSRAKQAINLPSDISTSDYLGDTPTARFYHSKAQTIQQQLEEQRNLATIIARRTAAASSLQPVGAATVKARRILAKTPSNVFLNQEQETGMTSVALIGFQKLFGWIWQSSHKVLFVFGHLPLLLTHNIKNVSPKTKSIILISLLSLGIFLYAISQLDLRSAKVAVTPVRNPMSKSIDRPLKGRQVDEESHITTNPLNEIKDQIAKIEDSISHAKHAVPIPELDQITDTFRASIQELQKRERLLEDRLNSISKQLNDLVQKSFAAASAKVPTDLKATNEQIASLQSAINSLKLDMLDIKEKIGLEELRNSIRREIADILPENLLVRKESSGTVIIEPALLESLNKIINARVSQVTNLQQAGNIISTSSVLDGETNGPVAPSAPFNLTLLEGFIEDKINTLEKRIINKEEIFNLIDSDLQRHLKSLISQSEHQNAQKALKSQLLILEKQLADQAYGQVRLNEFVREQLEELKKIEAVAEGDAMVDYALETMGARPIKMGTSSSYYPNQNIWFDFLTGGSATHVKPPKVALSADNSFGNCWAFAGQKGNLTIALGSEIVPSHFSIDHLSPTVNVDRSSAPRQFKVFALTSLDSQPMLLGDYEYDIKGPASQTFAAQYVLSRPVRYIRLSILSNHGRETFTCLYRFRVHSESGTLSELLTNNDAQ